MKTTHPPKGTPMTTALRPLDLETLLLKHGSHSNPDSEMCVMEAVAFVAGEPHSDHPACASEVIGQFLRTWNDNLDDKDRQILKPYVLRLVGTAASPEIEERRSWMALDWYIREMTPAWLRLAKLTEHADAVAGLPEITPTTPIGPAQEVLDRAARAALDASAASAAWAASAASAAWAALDASAASAAWAALDASAAWAALDASAASAASAAEKSMAAAIRPTVVELQQSALRLIDRMIDVGKSV